MEEIHWELLFLVQKIDYLRNEHWNTQKVCFSYQVWKGANPEANLDLFKQLFLIKPVKGTNINKYCFSQRIKSHTAKLYLSVVLQYFGENSKRTSVKKVSQKRHWNTQKFFFLPKGTNPEEICNSFCKY